MTKIDPSENADRWNGLEIPGRNASLVGRADDLIRRSPQLGELRRLLLALGGDEVELAGREFNLETLIERGRLFPANQILLRKMDRSNCHRNASRLCIESGAAVAIATGYSLGDEGIWRQHSWGIDAGEIIETTAVRRQYFGITLALEEAALFAAWNLSTNGNSKKRDAIYWLTRPRRE